MPTRPLLLFACLLACPAVAEQPPLPIEEPAEPPLVVRESQPLVDLGTSVQRITPDGFRLKFTAAGMIPREGKEPAPIVGDISRVDGRWVAGTASTPGYNQATHALEIVEGTASDSEIRIKLKATIKPDRWVPADKQTRQLTFTIRTQVKPLDAQADADPSKAGQFWTVLPKSGEPGLRIVGQAAIDNSPYAGEASGGAVAGTLSVPIAPARWNMGTLNEAGDAVRFGFDMGKQRGNWNHARLAQLGFDGSRDLSAWDGLRVAIRTDQPRDDAHVALWLREEDGSWYYVKYAASLIDRQNQAVLLWEDFSEAEWVSPSNHMDEDYVLDVSTTAVVGIGVVNSLGVGEVGFELTGIDRVKVDRPQREPAQAAVTGKLLSVQGHDVVPPGIFGGYAPDLPQRLRPGSQRYLYAGSYPRIPEQHHLHIAADDIQDAAKLSEQLRDKDQVSIASLRQALLADKAGKRLVEDIDKGRPLGTDRKALENAGKALTGVLRNRDLFGIEPGTDGWTPDAATLALMEQAEAGSINDTQQMRLNRTLLSVATQNAIAGPPAHGPSEAFYVDCLGERKEPAWLLSSANWEQRLDSLGRSFARNAKANDYVAHFEFWNEPYLNWAERSRVAFNLKFYDVENAGEDKPVRVMYRGKEGNTPGPVIPHFAWRKGKDGKWEVYDTTAFTFWSGRGNGWIYDQMFGVVAKAIKEEDPETRVIAGWGFRWHEDHWAAWDMLYKPTIDRNIQYIDAIHEHHYQGDTTAMNGSYEVLTAYGVTAHDKWLYSYNTETNDLVDAPARGGIDTPAKAANAKNYRRMTYNLRDMLYCVYQSPDKKVARALIHWPATSEGSTICMELLKNLRGRLIETQSPDPDVWVVASVDGTDPQALPPGAVAGKDQQHYTVLVFNNHRQPREVRLHIAAPTGTQFGDALIETVTVDDAFQLHHAQNQERNGTTFDQANHAITVPGRGVWKVTYTLGGRIQPDAAAEVSRHQTFSADILQHAKRGQPLHTTIKLDPAKLASASRAWLRIVVEDVERGEGAVTLNGKAHPLPHAIMGDNNNRIVQIPVEPGDLKADNDVVFTVNGGNFAGYRVAMASLVVERR